MIRIKYGPNQQEIKEVEIQLHMVGALTKKNKKRPEQKKNNPKHQNESQALSPHLLRKRRCGNIKKKLQSPPPHHQRRTKWCGGPRRRTHPYPLPWVQMSLHQANNEVGRKSCSSDSKPWTLAEGNR
jgi:hypothetical protein